ncbi:MAG: hypothetical protein K940chlam4_00310 [Candidatus Anoxychlamydiales bacterium]|nr:hypothetical protein [Candidatus Anoxychlamydiales bacterium]
MMLNLSFINPVQYNYSFGIIKIVSEDGGTITAIPQETINCIFNVITVVGITTFALLAYCYVKAKRKQLKPIEKKNVRPINTSPAIQTAMQTDNIKGSMNDSENKKTKPSSKKPEEKRSDKKQTKKEKRNEWCGTPQINNEIANDMEGYIKTAEGIGRALYQLWKK